MIDKNIFSTRVSPTILPIFEGVVQAFTIFFVADIMKPKSITS
ncbi:hypothetical protein SPAR65_0323 [Streptococcus pneumoniae GA40563]|nr:hypothetical protein SPAR65_0323 [Streptococcus pneumoniae GA40563]EJG71825.1 hypothetical protein AMCSP09_000391 [Streptococcus pneumoniae 2081074]EJG75816.1 hypothetical protein AMCSP18_000541 [Streptococcus pneumoniae 2082170]